MKISDNNQINGLPISNSFLADVKNFLFNTKPNLHHSHITGKIYGYAHGFCNRKVIENKNTITVIVHSLLGFDFFFFFKGLRFATWKTTNLSVGGANLSQINFANVRNQVKFLDTIKYYQQSLANLAESVTDQEKEKNKSESKRFIKKYQYFGPIFKNLLLEDQNWVLNYMSDGKGTIPYEILNTYDTIIDTYLRC